MENQNDFSWNNRSWDDLEEKLKEAQMTYSKAEESLQQFEAKIRVASPHYAAITQLQTVSLAETQTLLDKDTVVMEFCWRMIKAICG